MALFDALIDDLASRFGLGTAAAPLAKEALTLIVGGSGGIAGFLDLFKRAGLGGVASSWLGQADPAPLATDALEQALGAPAVDGIAHRVGIALPVASAALGYALPRLVGLLAPHGVVPAALPTEAAAFLAAPAAGDDHGHEGEVKQIRARAVAPGWLWPLVGVATVVGLGWAVWPILFPSNPPQAPTTQSAAPAPAAAPTPAVAEAPPPAPAAAAPPLAAPAAPAVEAATTPGAPAAAAPPVPAPAVPAVTTATAPVVAPAPVSPASAPSTLSIDDEAAGVTISGAVPDEKTRGAILDALKAVFGADAVKGDLTVDPNRGAAPWLTNLRAALEALKIPGLHAAFEGGAVEIGGAIPDRERVAYALKSVFGEGVRVGALVDSVGDWATIANAKASEALVALKTGFTAADLVSALNLSIVNFATDSAEVPTPTLSFLDTAAASLKALPAGYEIEVAGYTDDTGDPEANLALSLHRAEAVRNALVKGGAPAGALTAKGYGSVNPVATNDTEEGRFRNRRIEYHVTKTP